MPNFFRLSNMGLTDAICVPLLVDAMHFILLASAYSESMIVVFVHLA